MLLWQRQVFSLNRLSKCPARKNSIETKENEFTSAFGGAGVAVTGCLAFSEAFFVADVAVPDVFLSVMLEFYVDRRLKFV